MNESNSPRITFRVVDIYLPNPSEVLAELHGDEVVTGVLVGRSEGGTAESSYVIVDVVGLSRPVIVPVDRILETTPR